MTIERKGLEELSPEEALKLKSYYEEVPQGLFVKVEDLSDIPEGLQQLLKLHVDVFEQSRAKLRKKNHDYAGDGSSPDYDVFKNFRKHGPKGIIVRLDDKLSRLDTFVQNGKLEVEDEKLEDTVHDVVNYAVILLGLLRDKV